MIETLTNNKAVMFGAAVLAFLIAAVLVIMIFRMLFGGRLRMPGGRSRQARLGIVDAFDLDRQRQLIIVRRDNVEHLIMIGGPNDLVVESEIVRAEARDLRREPGFGDGRIPAPPPAASPEPAQLPPRALDEAMVPLAPPVPAEANGVSAAPPRGPTFPLPPRRPAPPPPGAPERRLAPPKLPETVSRGDDVPALSGQPLAPAPAPPQPVLPPVTRSVAAAPPPEAPPPPVTSATPIAPPPAGPSAAPPPGRPPFLKPLPPRPPVRPLQRTTPQPPSATSPAGTPPAPDAATPSTGGPPAPDGLPLPPRPATRPLPPRPTAPPLASPRPPAPATPPRPAAAPPPAPAKAPAPRGEEPADALESLEEEMAKLLGRGS